MRVIAIIPARYASTRFPGKPLALVGNVPMIERVYRAVMKSTAAQTIVATDDERIVQCVHGFGGMAVLTSPLHQSGTDRCGEVVNQLALADEDIVINVQGDEPFISEKDIDILIELFNNKEVNIATLIKPFEDISDISNPNKVKVICSKSGKALYFSRFAVPYNHSGKPQACYCKHIGIYGYRCKTLRQIIQLSPSSLEVCEQLEQLRWLENDFTIHTAICHYESIGIDTPEDLERAKSKNFL
ncbi:MAG: 3-deoxy-manno-octulosonate cytidylyltransferase [Bacteroidales bacterium]|jgi:3-deoxy-manno-octulosonate cytidylyltransferase (CMP-KDO synthetase)|nr:3-deoxy-manno-octulosonate cytidylyltransferase [Bacteroidales bacterium]